MLQDILHGKELKIHVLNKGFVRLVDCMPRLVPEGETCDYRVLEKARLSYSSNRQKSDKNKEADRKLLRYLMRHQHLSPFESVRFEFDIKMPIFVARQFVRHRTISLNEISGRYSELDLGYYSPSHWKTQSKANKQGGEEKFDEEKQCVLTDIHNIAINHADNAYKTLLSENVSKEDARLCLPVATYTQWYAQIDLRNLLHFLDLRCDSRAQHQSRAYANAMLDLVRDLAPVTVEAWEDYSTFRGATKLTADETTCLKKTLESLDISMDDIISANSLTGREADEFDEKIKKIFKTV